MSIGTQPRNLNEDDRTFGWGDGQTIRLATILKGALIRNVTLCKEGVYKIVRHVYYMTKLLRDTGSGWVTIRCESVADGKMARDFVKLGTEACQ